MKITVLKEGNFAVNREKKFYPLEKDSSKEYLRMAVQPFLIEIENELILIDAGLGNCEEGQPIIHKLITAEGYQPEDITKICISHLHKDHVNGLGRIENNEFVAHFPKAEIFIQERELDFALEQENDPSYDLEGLQHISKQNNLSKLHYNRGPIGNYIGYNVTGGHTAFHQEFLIGTQKEQVFYGGDNLPQRSYLSVNIAYKTDYEGKKAADAREDWKRKAKEKNWKLLLYHDMKFPVFEM